MSLEEIRFVRDKIVYYFIYMQRQFYCILFFILIKHVSFSQIEVTIGSQFDALASSLTRGSEGFIIGAYTGNQMFIVKKVKDSLSVTKYLTTAYSDIDGVISISVNHDTLFTKTIDSLFSDIKQNHNYRSYSKDLLISDNFFLIFYEKGKLQLFRQKEASQDQRAKAYFIHKRLNIYALIPYKGTNDRIKYLKIKNWKELLQYLGSGEVNSMSK